MAYDLALADVVREQLIGEDGLSEKAMFGGLAFLLGGRMAVAVGHDGGLMVRCPPEDTERLLAEPSAEPMVMRGKELTGWLDVHVDASDEALIARWVRIGAAYARSLPPK